MRSSLLLGCALAVLLAATPLRAESPTSLIRVLPKLAYKSADQSDYERERCFLDLYLPANRPGFPTLVWFHGGGLTAGAADAEFTMKNARAFAETGIAVAVAEYRLSPKTPFPGYAEDTAAAFAWVSSHIGEYSGDPEKLFIGGHSAGAYLSALVGMDLRFVKKHGLEQNSIAGLVLLSGQMMTHYTVRAERGIGKNTLVADEAAPIYHTRKDTPPMLVLWADRDMASRAEENAYFVAIQKMAGNTRVIGRQIADRDHGGIAKRMSAPGDEVAAAVVEFIEKIASERGTKP